MQPVHRSGTVQLQEPFRNRTSDLTRVSRRSLVSGGDNTHLKCRPLAPESNDSSSSQTQFRLKDKVKRSRSVALGFGLTWQLSAVAWWRVEAVAMRKQQQRKKK